MHRIILLFLIQTASIVYAEAIPAVTFDSQDILGHSTAHVLELPSPFNHNHASRPRSPPKPSASKPGPAAGGKPQSDSSNSASNPLFPELVVPYQDTATNLCELYLDCPYQDEDEPESLEIRKRYPALLDRTLSKRRTVDANLPSGKITLTAPNQPRSGLLYTGKRKNNDKNVFDFKDNKLGSRIVKNFKTIPKPTNEFATEHIIELQTIALFIEHAVKQNSALDSFFKNEWSKKRSATSVQNRPYKPSYKLDNQDSLMALVFEPFGSLQNPTHFVLCESQINLFKERIWGAKRAVMDEELYEAAVKEGMTGAIPSSVFLSAIRLTLGVYSYMNSPDVMAKMRIINNNIKLELSNAATLSGKQNIDLVPIWNTFLAEQFTKAEDWGVKWLKARMPETKAEIQSAMTKYRTLYRKLKQQEGSANAAQYAKSQKAKQTQLEKTLADQKAAVVATQGKLDTLRKSRKGKTDAQKKVITQQMEVAKKNLKNEIKKQGLIQRDIHELYSHSVQQILQNLQADNTRVVEYERATAGLQLTRP